MAKNVPQHLAIIMDGNRRWARERGLQVFAGHEVMVRQKLEQLVAKAIDAGVKYLTLWAFSTENWNRGKLEVDVLMNLFREIFSTQAERFHEKGVRINTLGEMSRFAPDIQQGVAHWKEQTKNNDKLVLTFAINYGGKDELLRAMRRMLEANPGLKPAQIQEDFFAQYLDSQQGVILPDPDLIIRTSGEERLSGFLTWQSAYAEFYFSKVMMPDFDDQEFDRALAEYARRQRRFGK